MKSHHVIPALILGIVIGAVVWVITDQPGARIVGAIFCACVAAAFLITDYDIRKK